MIFVGMIGVLLLVWPLICLIGFWCYGLVFPETMASLIQWTGLDISPWQLGLILGLVGGCFRSKAVSKSSCKDKKDKDNGLGSFGRR